MTVYFIGAGPGDPGLMTTRSLELIVAADVIVHDRLIPSGSLALARPDAELLYVGKEPGSAPADALDPPGLERLPSTRQALHVFLRHCPPSISRTTRKPSLSMQSGGAAFGREAALCMARRSLNVAGWTPPCFPTLRGRQRAD